MTTAIDTRVEALEERAEHLEARLARLEASGRAPVSVAPPSPVDPAALAPRAAAAEPPARPGFLTPRAARTGPRFARPGRSAPADTHPAARWRSDLSLEDLLGGRVLAWVGGLAVAVGIVLLLVIAASNGLIGEGARTLMGAGASIGLLLAGIRLHERRGRTDASVAAGAAGLAGLFAAIVVAALLYDLVPAWTGLGLALAVGATATALAIRWAAPGIGALGVVGALLAPMLVGADLLDTGTLLLVAVATASATGVLLCQRWNWLAYATAAVATPQWLWWLAGEDREPIAAIAVLVGFGLLGLAAAAGFELRSREPGLRGSAVVLLALNALVLAGAGWSVLDGSGHETAAHGWLVALALAHLAAGLVGARSRRVSRELALVAGSLGVILADVAFGTLANGPVLAIGWAASAAGFAALARRAAPDGADARFLAVGLGAHVALALGHAMAADAPVNELGEVRGDPVGPVLALASVAAACFASTRLADAGLHRWRVAVDALGLAVVAYATAVAVEHPVALTVAWAAEAAALAAIARRHDDEVAGWGALAFLGGATAFAVATLAPPLALLDGLDKPLAAAAALAACAGAAALLAWRGGPVLGRPPVRAGLITGAALIVLHLVSTELVTSFDGSPQQGQALLSGVWALVGVAALVAGLVRDVQGLRLGALALLGATIAKVFLYDLASLDSLARVASFIALGLLLLCGAFAWQRLRPTSPPDLRRVPASLR